MTEDEKWTRLCYLLWDGGDAAPSRDIDSLLQFAEKKQLTEQWLWSVHNDFYGFLKKYCSNADGQLTEEGEQLWRKLNRG